jgi:acid phosphatase type 7
MRVFATLAALATAVLAASNDTTPMQLRLAHAGDTGMYVSWNTYCQLEEPTVCYGTSPNDLCEVASSNVSVTYHTSTTYNSHVKLSGLKPGTQYYYKPQDSNVTKPYSFKTSRPAGDHTPFTAALVVDLGTMGRDGGLSTVVGKGAANPLTPRETNTIQSLSSQLTGFEFLWHRKSHQFHPRPIPN